MHYLNGKGKEKAWRMGAWIAQTEVKSRTAKLRKLLVEHGLKGSFGDVMTYLQVGRKVGRGWFGQWCSQPTMPSAVVTSRSRPLPEVRVSEGWKGSGYSGTV